MTRLVGILNVTPDSFSDGGQFLNPDTAAQHYHALLAQGAAYVDIGAESTRPGAVAMSPEQEWQRLEPVLRAIAGQGFSVDTRHASVAARALAAGAGLINDVSGLADPEMLAVLAPATCKAVAMHALSVPADSTVCLPGDVDPVAAVLAWKVSVIERASAAGIDPARLIFDPGLGFGKTKEQSLALVNRAAELVASGGEWFFGHSRKSFLTLIRDVSPPERDALSIEVSLKLAEAGVHYLRVHDVAGHAEALCM